MKLAHFYHAYAGGSWQEPVTDHLAVLGKSGFDYPVHLGLVGPWRDCDDVLGVFRQRLGLDVREAARAEVGWEQVTLDAVLQHAQHNDGAVLYAHTKGAHTPGQAVWRDTMARALIVRWRDALSALESGAYDAAGPDWRTNCFVGNYWMATCECLRTSAGMRSGVALGSGSLDREGWAPRRAGVSHAARRRGGLNVRPADLHQCPRSSSPTCPTRDMAGEGRAPAYRPDRQRQHLPAAPRVSGAFSA